MADFLQVKCDFRWKTAVLRLRATFKATYDVHLTITGKHIVDLLLVLTQLFLLGAISEALRANID